MNTHQILPGDRLLIKKPPVTHSGTYMGGGLVAHISPEKGLRVESLADFAGGQNFGIVRNGGIPEQVLWERYQQAKHHAVYGLLSNNCEQLSGFLETGRATSPQLGGGLFGAAVGLFAAKYLGVRNEYALAGITALSLVLGAALAAPRPNDSTDSALA